MSYIYHSPIHGDPITSRALSSCDFAELWPQDTAQCFITEESTVIFQKWCPNHLPWLSNDRRGQSEKEKCPEQRGKQATARCQRSGTGVLAGEKEEDTDTEKPQQTFGQRDNHETRGVRQSETWGAQHCHPSVRSSSFQLVFLCSGFYNRKLWNGGLTWQGIYFHSSRGWRSKIWCQQVPCVWWELLSQCIGRCHLAVSSHGRDKEREREIIACVSSCKITKPIKLALPSCQSTSQSPRLLTLLHWGVTASTHELGAGTQAFSQ